MVWVAWEHPVAADLVTLLLSGLFLKSGAGCAGKIHLRNTVEQLKLVGPRSLGVALLTAGFVGMVFTIQARPDLALWASVFTVQAWRHAACMPWGPPAGRASNPFCCMGIRI